MQPNREGGTNMEWDAELYDGQHGYVGAYGAALVQRPAQLGHDVL